MSITDATTRPGSEARAPNPGAKGRAIFHPAVDFLCLGGLSLIVIPLAIALPAEMTPALFALMLVLSDVINHPHFAASYQIFYRDFRSKLLGDRLDLAMRIRYAVAGIVVPLAMAVFFAVCLLRNDGVSLGLGANLMFFLVGWHYTKQGYGMLIVDSVFKRQFFSEIDKTILRHNAYACWILYWVMFNNYFYREAVWGLQTYTFPVPDWAVWASAAVAAVTSARMLLVFARRLAPGGGGLPMSGTVAYVVSLYIWLAARFAPGALLVVPALHSLQYLLIVSRFEINRAQSVAEPGAGAGRSVALRVGSFAVTAVVLGLAGFYWLPQLLERTVDYDRDALGGGLVFMFMASIFINVHHYFIDNVIWRRENPEVGEFLFGTKPKAA